MTATKTATATSINSESITFAADGTAVVRYYDTLLVTDADGEEIATVSVESSEDEQPYLDALAAAGHADAKLVS